MQVGVEPRIFGNVRCGLTAVHVKNRDTLESNTGPLDVQVLNLNVGLRIITSDSGMFWSSYWLLVLDAYICLVFSVAELIVLSADGPRRPV